MRRRKTIGVSLFVVVAVVGFLYSARALHEMKSRRIVVGRDMSDVTGAKGAQQAKSEYEHYFDRVNRTDGLALTSTNSASVSQ